MLTVFILLNKWIT